MTNWYHKYAYNNDNSETNRDSIEEELKDIADYFGQELMGKYRSGEYGILGKTHFVVRPGTEISISPDITPDEIIQENIDKFGDFPVVVVWGIIPPGKPPREAMPASEFMRRRRSGEFTPSNEYAAMDQIADEYLSLLQQYEGRKDVPDEVQKRMNYLLDMIMAVPSRPYARKAFVSEDWVSPVDELYIDRRELEGTLSI